MSNGNETALRDSKLRLASIFMFLSGTDQKDNQAYAEFCSEAEGFLEDWLNNRDISTYRIIDIVTGETLNWSLNEVLKEINRDHDEDWIPYDETDWREGWDEFVEGDLYRLIG